MFDGGYVIEWCSFLLVEEWNVQLLFMMGMVVVLFMFDVGVGIICMMLELDEVVFEVFWYQMVVFGCFWVGGIYGEYFCGFDCVDLMILFVFEVVVFLFCGVGYLVFDGEVLKDVV